MQRMTTHSHEKLSHSSEPVDPGVLLAVIPRRTRGGRRVGRQLREDMQCLGAGHRSKRLDRPLCDGFDRLLSLRHRRETARIQYIPHCVDQPVGKPHLWTHRLGRLNRLFVAEEGEVA
jgi:hypothetical protein